MYKELQKWIVEQRKEGFKHIMFTYNGGAIKDRRFQIICKKEE